MSYYYYYKVSPPCPPRFLPVRSILSPQTSNSLLSLSKMLRCKFRRGGSLTSKVLVSASLCRGFSSLHRRLEGKVALITGGASGIGKETASKFLENGAKVVIADIQHQLGHQIAQQLGDDASFIPCDVTQESDLRDVVDFVVSKHGHLDIMYNNAGIACKTPPSIVDLDLNVFDHVMAINVRGIMAGSKHAARVMIPHQKGCILCTASVTGTLGGLAQHTYSASKSSVLGIVRSLAAELSRHGIRVNGISPFCIPTPFVMDELKAFYPGVGDERLRKMVYENGELKGEKCEEVDVANAALYLASDEAKYVSGHNLVVDGGFTAFKTLVFHPPHEVQ